MNKQLLAGMPEHKAVIGAQVGEALPLISRHAAEDRTFAVHDLIMGKRQDEILEECVVQTEQDLAVMVVVRVEQLYPWPERQLIELAEKYTDCDQVWWVQEEPANMGAWNYVHGKLHRILRDRARAAGTSPDRRRRHPRAGAPRSTTASRSSSSSTRSPTSA